jgi:anti-anti-sigma factor
VQGSERDIGDVLRVREEEEGDRHVVYLIHELDLTSTDEFMEELVAIAERVAPTELVLDLGELRFIDSKGVAALAAAELIARKAGVRALYLRRPAKQVERVLTLTSIMEHLPMLKD